MARRTIPLPFAVDLHRSLRPTRLGTHDPTVVMDHDVMLRATRTPLGPATLRVEHRGTDTQMLELLEPFAGHRGRVCLLIESARISAPHHGPRMRIEPIAAR